LPPGKKFESKRGLHPHGPQGKSCIGHRERPRRHTHWINRSTGGNPEARTKAEENFKTMIALRRIGDPKEAGEVIAWLCSDAAS
jgi:NAD(P)-dependent dehydrogenase (short-subunit alcohol dehydrogenase family)